VDFSGDSSRLPNCVIKICFENDDDRESDIEELVEKVNNGIYHDRFQIRKIKRVVEDKQIIVEYVMNINAIVIDYIFQDISDAVKRDMKLNNVLVECLNF
jgi:hypothetical protein